MLFPELPHHFGNGAGDIMPPVTEQCHLGGIGFIGDEIAAPLRDGDIGQHRMVLIERRHRRWIAGRRKEQPEISGERQVFITHQIGLAAFPPLESASDGFRKRLARHEIGAAGGAEGRDGGDEAAGIGGIGLEDRARLAGDAADHEGGVEGADTEFRGRFGADAFAGELPRFDINIAGDQFGCCLRVIAADHHRAADAGRPRGAEERRQRVAVRGHQMVAGIGAGRDMARIIAGGEQQPVEAGQPLGRKIPRDIIAGEEGQCRQRRASMRRAARCQRHVMAERLQIQRGMAAQKPGAADDKNLHDARPFRN
jgi:hypothetical protein